MLNKLADLILLKKVLTKHDYRYYILNDPIIVDQEYDKMYKKYESLLHELIGQDTRSLELEHCYPQWVRDGFKDAKPLA